MSGLAIAALIVVSVWLGILTIAYLLIVRQVALLGMQVDRAAPGLANDHGLASDYRDGLPEGTPVPEPVFEALPHTRTGVQLLLVLSGTCAPCREMAPQLASSKPYAPLTVLIPGRAAVAEQVFHLMHGFDGPVMRAADADRLTNALGITSTPSVTVVRDGHVIATRFVKTLQDLERPH